MLADDVCDVLMIDYEHIVKRCPKACAHHSTVVANLVKLMSEKTQALSEHLEILSRRTTREKLTAYFSLLAAKNKSAYFTLPFSQTSLADYICVDRSALSAQLSRLRREGLEARLIMQVHDELIVECPEGEAERVKTLLTEEMEQVMDLSVPLTAEAHSGKNWLEAK